MNLLEELFKIYPQLKKQYNSEQYCLSEVILDYAIDSMLNQNEIAEKLGLDLNKYLRMELGDNSIPVEDYLELINKMKTVLLIEE